MTTAEVLGRLAKVRPHGERAWMACCPAHADKNPSLSVSEGADGRTLLKCFAGCSAEAVVAALGLKMADLMGPARETARAPARARAAHDGRREKRPFSLAGLKPGAVWTLGKREHRFVEGYDYRDEKGAVLFRKLRFREAEGPGKTFVQVSPAEGGLWRWGRAGNGVREVLYRLPELLAAAATGREAWVVEGEKDVEAARRLGLVATCNADGAGHWRAEFAACFNGCSKVWIVADRDPDEAEAKRENPKAKAWWQGQAHATEVLESLRAAGIEAQALTLPDVDGFAVKDLSDWVAAHGASAPAEALRVELQGLAAAAPEWPCAQYRRSGGEQTALALAAGTPHMGGAASSGGRGGEDDSDPASVAALRKRLIEILTDTDASGMQKKRMLAEAVCAWLGVRGRFYFDLADRGHGTAMWFDAREKRLHRVRQDYFRSWLSRATAFSREFRDYKMFVAGVEDEALVGDATLGITPRRFWHREGDAVYISSGEGRMVRVTAGGVDEVDNGTDGVVFEQGFVLSPWSLCGEGEARDPFAACQVFSGISTVDGRGLMLVRLWFMGMFGVDGWKPLLVLSGDVGSGKTRVAAAMFQLLGIPQRVTAIDALGNVKDFWASVDKGGLFCLDNADHHIQWLPDALSVIATGGTFEKKKLYTDTETVTQEARCWAVVTSANPSFAADAGLADRLITVLLQRVDRDTAESTLTREIEAARDAGLSWICHTMRRALADDLAVPRGMNRRHPDWAGWVWRLGAAAGMAVEAESAIRENEGFKATFALQNDAFGRFLLAGILGPFKGTAEQLSQHLKAACEGFDPEFWSYAKIGKALKRLNVALNQVFGFAKLNHSGTAVYVFGAPSDPAAAADAARDLLSPPMVGVVGDVGDQRTKSHIDSPTRDFYQTTPHIPHIPPHSKTENGGREEELNGGPGGIGGAEWASL